MGSQTQFLRPKLKLPVQRSTHRLPVPWYCVTDCLKTQMRIYFVASVSVPDPVPYMKQKKSTAERNARRKPTCPPHPCEIPKHKFGKNHCDTTQSQPACLAVVVLHAGA